MRLLGAVLLALVLTAGSAQAAGDPRWEFYTGDKTRYTSPWFAGGHRIMIPFGCTRAPYYDADPRCKKQRGFHHGIDVAMKCGTPLRAGRRGWVVSSEGLGPAYGSKVLRIRNYTQEWDVVIGHARRVLVEPGDRVRAGQRIARAGADAAPDGCHLHFEKRAMSGGLSTAVHPRRLLGLRPRR
ncbi:M23 family metallopeptidase [Nocardioides euryhalodurans]|uniref:M23 family metallopeptidase n=1 Tax=Nocardioides euryhalodurans TaxID=2518370 RepID=A0A4P7GPS7_9ACTN|nr:M23 family metallopeptidase [Nocardioides euryhalodurans]QBR94019.1 M23 family metallopeptidase [Nocardioides euryhalodurans]